MVLEEVLCGCIITFSLQKLILNQGQMDYPYFFGFHHLFSKSTREDEVEAMQLRGKNTIHEKKNTNEIGFGGN